MYAKGLFTLSECDGESETFPCLLPLFDKNSKIYLIQNPSGSDVVVMFAFAQCKRTLTRYRGEGV